MVERVQVVLKIFTYFCSCLNPGSNRILSRIFTIIFILIYLGIVGEFNLYAQRGSGFSSQDNFLKTNTLSGFPGMFDVNLPKEHSLVISSPTFISGSSDIATTGGYMIIPYLNVDFGFNESFSIGTNLITFLPFASGGAGGSLKARSKVFENNYFSDVITSYAGAGFFDDDKGLNYSFNYFMLTDGAKFNLTSSSTITAFIHFWSIYFSAIQKEIDQNYQDSQFTIDILTSFVGANYHLSFQHIGLSAAIVIPFYVDFSQDTLTYRVARNVIGFDKSFVTLRSGVDIKIGRGGLLSLGVSYMEFSSRVLNQSAILWGGYSHKIGF